MIAPPFLREMSCAIEDERGAGLGAAIECENHDEKVEPNQLRRD
jgi:hypothetical protein